MQSYLIFLELYFIVSSFLTFGRDQIFQKLNVEPVRVLFRGGAGLVNPQLAT